MKGNLKFLNDFNFHSICYQKIYIIYYYIYECIFGSIQGNKNKQNVLLIVVHL